MDERNLASPKFAPSLSAKSPHQRAYSICKYDLNSTLSSGQTFRWHRRKNGWEGVIDDHWIEAKATDTLLFLRTSHPDPNWMRLEKYFQINIDIDAITSRFPSDRHLNYAVQHFQGLRLLRQSPWECLASFILSSSKRIAHIEQIVERLSRAYGRQLILPKGVDQKHQFPDAECISQLSESDLRKLGMGYRAPFLQVTAQRIARCEIDLDALSKCTYQDAKKSLQQLPGVGPKIADCVLLFAFGFQDAFPIDVWIRRALSQLYFPNKPVSSRELRDFASTYFQPFSGYAQQYLFHAMRTQHKKRNPPFSH